MLVDMIIILGKGVIWNISKFPLVESQNVPKEHHWAYIAQTDRNLYLLFTHFLTWKSHLNSPPNIDHYVAESILFQEYETV